MSIRSHLRRRVIRMKPELDNAESAEDFDRFARRTGCFRQARAIRDPRTHRIIGYELEEISFAETTEQGSA